MILCESIVSTREVLGKVISGERHNIVGIIRGFYLVRSLERLLIDHTYRIIARMLTNFVFNSKEDHLEICQIFQWSAEVHHNAIAKLNFLIIF